VNKESGGIVGGIKEFLQLESAGGIVLLAAALLALIVTNTPLGPLYKIFLTLPVEVRFGALQIASNLVAAGQYAAYERDGAFTAGWDALYSAVSISALLMMWVAFFPPAFYRRWVTASVPAES